MSTSIDVEQALPRSAKAAIPRWMIVSSVALSILCASLGFLLYVQVANKVDCSQEESLSNAFADADKERAQLAMKLEAAEAKLKAAEAKTFKAEMRAAIATSRAGAADEQLKAIMPFVKSCNISVPPTTTYTTTTTTTQSTTTTTRAGACSSAEEALILMKFGKDGRAWGDVTSDCGHSSYSIWSGFDVKSFVKCQTGKVEGLSVSCAACFAGSVSYGASNCKWKCGFGRWCSKGCLECGNKYAPSLTKCTGFQTPEPEMCD